MTTSETGILAAVNRLTVRQYRVLAVLVLAGMFFGSHFIDSHGISLKTFQWHVTFTYTTAGVPSDKLVHFSCFSLLTWLVGRSRFFGPSKKINLLAATLFVCFYGVFDELTQGMVGRDCEVSDWLADAMAAWSMLIARWPMGRSAKSTSLRASILRMTLCIAACLAVPGQAALSKLRGGPFSRPLIQERQYFVLAGLVAIACLMMLASLLRPRSTTATTEPLTVNP